MAIFVLIQEELEDTKKPTHRVENAAAYIKGKHNMFLYLPYVGEEIIEGHRRH